MLLWKEENVRLIWVNINRIYIKNTLLCLLKFIRSVFHGFEFFTAHPAKKISYTFHIIPRLLLFYHGAINHVSYWSVYVISFCSALTTFLRTRNFTYHTQGIFWWRQWRPLVVWIAFCATIFLLQFNLQMQNPFAFDRYL